MKKIIVKMLLVAMVVGMFTSLTLTTGYCADDAEPRPHAPVKTVVQK